VKGEAEPEAGDVDFGDGGGRAAARARDVLVAESAREPHRLGGAEERLPLERRISAAEASLGHERRALL